MESAGEVYDFFVNSQLENQNVFFFIFWLNQKLIPLFRSEKKGRIADHFSTLLCEILLQCQPHSLHEPEFHQNRKAVLYISAGILPAENFTDTCSIAAFLFPLFYTIKEIGGIKIGKLVIPDLVASSNINIVFASYRLHFTLSDRLAVAHVSAESVAFETAGNVADMADCPEI